ncbi:DUF2500 family protein [Blastopirellula marina]|uniref:Zinc-ribbon domain-containing protein n=1 Tax=Blastopirellula marina TaxID=124 RepID=A0A2S8GM87_9BACT|nr:DUF2500 family protein [Blastopirellula marina]PQO45461.1 hypothetical protein C5Y93_13500 [Blastopirellula marina]
MKCPSCGASFPENASICEYCGSRVPEERHVSADRSEERIFQQIKESTAFAQRNNPARIQQMPQPSSLRIVGLIFFMVIWCGAGLFLTSIFWMVAGPLALIPLAMIIFGVFFAATRANKFLNHIGAPVDSFPAIVAGKRMAVSGGEHTSTSYYLTFEFEDGKRDEFPVYDGRIYGKVTEEDAGILYLRNRYAVDFERVRM